MKNEKIKEAFEKAKPAVTKVVRFTIITVALVASFLVGRFTENYKQKKNAEQEMEIISPMTRVQKEDVNIAIDETNNLIIIDEESGKYTIYQDSIGHAIFKLYARSIWTQHDESN